MRLIDVTSMKLVEFLNEVEIPPYGILSHRWGSDELSFQDYQKPSVRSHPGYAKIANFCRKVSASALQYAWVDTCCIDKTSSAELSESINSMFNWYRKAGICYIYLEDISVKDLHNERDAEVMESLQDCISQSVWFTRGWTLQELLAPQIARFYDQEWRYFGSKEDIIDVLSSVTGIEAQYLLGQRMETASIAKRMFWASRRKTTRIEDTAYCLLGIFGVNMPLLYGEGKKAFTRLQEEIMKQSADQSLFAWTALQKQPQSLLGPLATSPTEFFFAGGIVPYPDLVGGSSYTMTNQGLRMDIPLLPHPDVAGLWYAILGCHKGWIQSPLAIVIRPTYSSTRDGASSNQYGRSSLHPEPIPVTSEMLGNAVIKTIYLKSTAVEKLHDKTYSLNLRLAKSWAAKESTDSVEVELGWTYPVSTVIKENDAEDYWYAELASDSANIGLALYVGSLTYVLCIKVTHPENHKSELDWWLRSRCQCRLVRPIDGYSEDMDSLELMQMIRIEKIGKELDRGLELFDASTLKPDLRLTVELRKDFEDRGVVINVDLRFVKCYELEDTFATRMTSLPESLTRPRFYDAIDHVDDEPALAQDGSVWSDFERVEERQALLERIFPPY